LQEEKGEIGLGEEEHNFRLRFQVKWAWIWPFSAAAKPGWWMTQCYFSFNACILVRFSWVGPFCSPYGYYSRRIFYGLTYPIGPK